jgi:hypothetical protein
MLFAGEVEQVWENIVASFKAPRNLPTPTPRSESANELFRPRDRRLSANLVPAFADRECYVVSMTDPYGRILGFLDRTCCINPIDNTHYAPVGTTPSTRTKYITRYRYRYRPSDRRLSAKLVPMFAEMVPRGQPDGSLRPYSRLFRLEPPLFLPSSSSIVLTRPSEPRSRPATSQKI